ncbi:MAG TPA: DNRLRE domain-containing protein, partial [Polyangiaceae bacterium]
CVSSDRAAAGLASEIRFGGPLGRSALYLKFPSDWRTRGIPRQAFLVLSARAGSASSDLPVTLEAWRISADWQPGTLRRWSDKPSLAPPYARTRISASPAQDLRIDVTELVRFAAHNPERDFGIALIASGSEGPAASFSSGLAGGRAPRLELYLR